jgi:hypothetical protein
MGRAAIDAGSEELSKPMVIDGYDKPADTASGPGTVNNGAPAITIDQLVVHAKGDKPEDFAQAVRDELRSVLEGMAIEMGAVNAV